MSAPGTPPRDRLLPFAILWSLAVLLLLALAFLAPPSEAQEPAPPARTAWDAIVEAGPAAGLEGVSPMERQALNALTPEEGRGLLEGDGLSLSLDEVLAAGSPRGGSGRGREMIFVPLEPCSIADTRRAGGAFGNDEIRHFVVRGETTDYSPQGGTSAGCGIPGLSETLSLSNTAQAVLLHFEVLGATRAGKLTAWAANWPQPPLSHLSYLRAPFFAGTPTHGTSGVAVVPLCDEAGIDPCPFGDVRLRLSGGAHLALAVHGYFLGDEAVPSGLISMWSGALADIPLGWALCDGTGGTPAPTDRFILGAAGGEEPGATGGAHEYSLTEDQLAAHGHSATTSTDGAHHHSFTQPARADFTGSFVGIPNPRVLWDPYRDGGGSTDTKGAHSHTVSIGPTGASAPIDNRPAFFKLAFIMKL